MKKARLNIIFITGVSGGIGSIVKNSYLKETLLLVYNNNKPNNNKNIES